MSDIVLVEPCVFYALEGGINHAAAAAPGTAAGTCVDLTATPHTHMALYEWIRSFVESGWEARHGASFSVHDLEEAEAVLRELIALDESQVRMHRITTCHVAWLQCDQQRRQRDIAVTEALSRYQLHRLLHWEQRLSAGDDNDNDDDDHHHHQHQQQQQHLAPQQAEQHMLQELRQHFTAEYTPAITRAAAAQKFAEDRLQAVMRVLEHQTANFEATQRELNAVCGALNELAAHAQVEARCEESRGSAYAAVRGGNGELSTPQRVADAVRDKLSELLAQRTRVGCNTVVSKTEGGFDALMVALYRLEEARTECYALKRKAAAHDRELEAAAAARRFAETGASSLSRLPAPAGTALVGGFEMESRAYEVYLTALQEQRRLLLLLKSMWGVHAVLLRLSQERHAEQYAERPLSLFVAHNVSLHQWVDANSARPTRHTAVFYALPPHRSNELPYEQLEAVLIAKAKMSGSTFDVIDLRPLAAGGAQLSGGAVRFSANGEFMYVCCGTTGCDAEVRASTLRIVDALRSGLGVSSSNCFCYYASPDAAATGGGLGWAAVGICAWALDEMSFDSAAERQRFVSHLREAYRTSLHLTRADVQNFAGECVEIVSRSPRHGSPKRQLVISSGALRALSEDNRAALTAWYNNGGCVVPDVTTVERVGGYSVASMMIAVVTHGAETPPPTARGLLASSGIGQCE